MAKTTLDLRKLLILLCLTMLFPGCTPPPVSIFVGEKPLSLPGDGFPLVQADGYYLLEAAYTNTSLARRLRDSSVRQVDIHCTNGDTFEADSSRLRDSLLICWAGDREISVNVDSVERVVIAGAIPWDGAGQYVPQNAFIWAFLGAFTTLTGQEHIEIGRVALRTALGAGIGAGIGLMVTTSSRPKETILFRNYSVVR